MNSQSIALTALAAALLAVACSSSSNYSGGYETSGYNGAAYSASSSATAGSSTPGTSLSADIHSVIHEQKQDERVFKAEKTEPLLDSSGFKSMPIDTPAKQKVIGGLAPLSFNRLARHGKIHYWFADPYYCKCVYVGDELAYQRYKQTKRERKQEKIETSYLVDSENQVDMPMNSEWDPVSAFGMP